MGRGTTTTAALAATFAFSASVVTAQAQEAEPAPQPPPSAETVHGQLDAAIKAQPLVGVRLSVGDSALGEMMSMNGVYDLQRKRYGGSMKFLFLNIRVYSTPKRTLVRLQGTSCWEVDKSGDTGAPAAGSLLASPDDLIDKDSTGPAVFSVTGAQEIKWTLGGRVPTDVVETYNPATMLPSAQRVSAKVPKTKSDPASTVTMNTDYSYAGLALNAPKNPTICKTKKKKR